MPTPLQKHMLAPRVELLRADISKTNLEDASDSSLNENEDELTSLEIETVDTLEKWGIEKRFLLEAAPLGSRSPAVATYRILLHRLYQRSLGSSLTPDGRLSPGSARGDTSPISRPSSPSRFSRKSITSLAKFKMKIKNGQPPTEEPTQKSKTCTIF